ncbi:PR domain zinc finger protein 8 [Boleophthalmus pectinirostris]|uniref:PR domain zinc finger protein 8 n=1 Tax=Boleophthalmus pectinirostris TaxID=150288 RepID=UPI000A1C5776|nr:PR domain zinc finger protein 8 [Boleophthalmus pectinirostris]
MFTSLSMEPTLIPRCAWSGESKSMQLPPDVHTSVVVTRSIPSGTCFGPCVLQSTFDSIAFIAQKSSDTRNKAYVFRVDPEALSNSALLLSWLRLIQAARNAEEQNTEAFLKAGQLHVRTKREVRSEEELLMWYDEELCHLLGFTDLRRELSQDFKCTRCSQVFKHEYPFLAHCRFLCTQMKADTWSPEYTKHKEVYSISKRQHKVTDFHNIARDLEQKNKSEAVVNVSSIKRKYEDTLYHKSRKAVLLEKTNISNDVHITTYEHLEMGGSSTDLKEVDKSGCKKDNGLNTKMSAPLETGESSNSSAFSLISSNTQGELKSAFCKPHKRTTPLNIAPTAPSSCVEEIADAVASSRALMGYNLMASSVLNTEMHSSLSSAATLNSAFHYAPEHWSRNIGAHLHPKSSPSSSLTTLPPTFTSFGVSVQNWCAKCNLSFRMTSDLVFHMRSHHKKEFAAESQVRRRREEKLTCPICHEYFRERHHLSRHMTSHN